MMLDLKFITKQDKKKLDSIITEYLESAKLYDKGFLIFYYENMNEFKFNYFYSSNGELPVKSEDSREETAARIIFVLNCKDIVKDVSYDDKLDIVKKSLISYIVGFSNIYLLDSNLGIKNFTKSFVKNAA